MAVQSKITIPLCITPLLAGKRVPCLAVSGDTHSILADGPSAKDNCCMANTSMGIAWAITNQLNVVYWSCFKCQTQNVTNGPSVNCGLDYRASVPNTAKVWVLNLANAPGLMTAIDSPITFLEVATILMGPHGVENTRLQNPTWATHSSMCCDECSHEETEPQDLATKSSSTVSPEANEVEMRDPESKS
jgi:hypothetical protein